MLQAAPRRATVAMLALFAFATLALSQSDNASISGVVKDSTNAVVANAKSHFT